DGLAGPEKTTLAVAGHRLWTWLDPEGFGAALAERGWLPTAPDWAGGLRETWTPGEKAARARLDELSEVFEGYDEARERPDRNNTSFLSPRLRFGELSPHEVWHRSLAAAGGGTSAAVQIFRDELLWREFAWHRRAVLPRMDTENIRPEFDDFTWDDDPEVLRAWRQGRTGVPLVDAGMREL